MQIILLALLVAVWGAFVLPSFLQSRRETPVTTRQRTAEPRRAAIGPAPAAERQRVLARRRMALVTLGVLAIGTLALAIITGSLPILILSLIVDVMLAGYIAILLQIKQGRPVGEAVNSPPRTGTTVR
jgi:hypothetical protein